MHKLEIAPKKTPMLAIRIPRFSLSPYSGFFGPYSLFLTKSECDFVSIEDEDYPIADI